MCAIVTIMSIHDMLSVECGQNVLYVRWKSMYLKLWAIPWQDSEEIQQSWVGNCQPRCATAKLVELLLRPSLPDVYTTFT